MLLLFVHFFVGWDWLSKFQSSETTERRRTELIATLDGYARSSPQTINTSDLGERVPNMTEVQLDAFENSLKGRIVTARGPIYDVQAASDRYGLTRFDVVVWSTRIMPSHLPVRGTCVARNSAEAQMLRGLSVGSTVTITGNVRSVGRLLGVSLTDCVIAVN